MSKNLGKIDDVDTRVVEMQFDNKQFEKGASATLNTLEKLKAALKFDGVNKGFDSLQKGIDAVTFNPITRQLDNVSGAFTTLYGSIKRNFFDKISNDIIQVGANLYNTTVGQIISGGKTRAMNIAQAKFKMEGMNVAWEDIKDDLDYAVSGTAYGLDAAASIASQLVASGVQVGKGMKKALRGVSGVAAMTSSSYEEIGQVFAAVAGQGKAMAMQLNQLSLRGINAASTIGEYLGKTEAEVREMASKGQISFEIFADAMDSAFGEHAKEANKTFTGAMSNIRAALSKVGELFYGPFYDAAIAPLNTIRETISMIKDGLVGAVDGYDTKFGMRSTAERIEQLVHVLGDIANIILKGIQNGLKRALKYLRPVNKVMISWLHNLKELRSWLKSIIPDDSTQKLEEVKTGIEGITEAEKEMAYGVWEGKYGNGIDRINALGESYERVQTYLQALIDNNFDAAKAEKLLGISSEKTNDELEEQSELGQKLNKVYTVVKRVFESAAAIVIYLGKRLKTVSERIGSDIYEMIHPLSTMSGFMTHSFREADKSLSNFLEQTRSSTPLEALLTTIAHTIYLITEGIWEAYKAVKSLAGIVFGTIKQLLGSNVLVTVGEVIAFLNEWIRPDAIIKPIRDVIEIFVILGKNLALTFKSVAVAFAMVFDNGASGMIGDVTGGILNFVKTLEFTQNDVNNLIRIFRGFFSIIKIVLDAVGALAKGFNVLTDNFDNEDSVLLRILGTFGDFFYELKNIIEDAHVFERVIYDIVIVLEVLFQAIEKVTGVFRGDWLIEVLKGVLDFINFVAENGIIAGIQVILEVVETAIGGIMAAIAKFPVLMGLVKDVFKGIATLFGLVIQTIYNLGGMAVKVSGALNKFGASYFNMMNSLFEAVLPEGYKTPFESLTEGTIRAKNDFEEAAENIRIISENGATISKELADRATKSETNTNIAVAIAKGQIKRLLDAAAEAASSSETMNEYMGETGDNITGVIDKEEIIKNYLESGGTLSPGSAAGMLAGGIPLELAAALQATQTSAMDSIKEESDKKSIAASNAADSVKKSTDSTSVVAKAFDTGLANIKSFFGVATTGINDISAQAKAISAGAKTATFDEEQAMKALAVLQSMNAIFISIMTTISFFKLASGISKFGEGIQAVGSALSFAKKLVKKYQRRLMNAMIFEHFSNGLKNVAFAVISMSLAVVAVSYMIKDIGDTDVVKSAMGIVAGLLITIGVFVFILSRIRTMFGVVSLWAVVAIIVSVTLALGIIWSVLDNSFGKDKDKDIKALSKKLKAIAKVIFQLSGAIVVLSLAIGGIIFAAGKFASGQTARNLSRLLHSMAPILASMALVMLSMSAAVFLIAKAGIADESVYKRVDKIWSSMMGFMIFFALITDAMVAVTAIFASSSKNLTGTSTVFTDAAKTVSKMSSTLIVMLSSIAIIGALIFLAKNVWADSPEKYEEFVDTMQSIADGIKNIFYATSVLIAAVVIGSGFMARSSAWRDSFDNLGKVLMVLSAGLAVIFVSLAAMVYTIGSYNVNQKSLETVLGAVNGIFIAMTVMLVAVMAGSAVLSKYLVDPVRYSVFLIMVSTIGVLLLGLSAILVGIMGAITVLSLVVSNSDVAKVKDVLWGAVGMLAALFVGTFVIMGFSALANTNAKLIPNLDMFLTITATLILLAGIIGGIMLLIGTLASMNIDSGKLGDMMALMAVVSIILTVMTAGLFGLANSKLINGRADTTLAYMAGSLALMAVAIASVMFSLAILIKMINETDGINGKAVILVTLFATVVVGLMAVIVGLAASFAKKKDMSDKKLEATILSMAGAIALICAGFAAIILSLAIFGNTKVNMSNLWGIVVMFVGILVVVGVIFVMAYGLSEKVDMERVGQAALVMMAYAASVALVCAAMSLMSLTLMTLSKYEINWHKLWPVLLTFSVILLIVGAVAVLTAWLANEKANPKAIATAMLSLGLAVASIALGFIILAAAIKGISDMDITDRELEVFDKLVQVIVVIMAIILLTALAGALSYQAWGIAGIVAAYAVAFVAFGGMILMIAAALNNLKESGAIDTIIESADTINECIFTIEVIFGLLAALSIGSAIAPAGTAAILEGFTTVTLGLIELAAGIAVFAAAIMLLATAVRVMNGESIADIIGDVFHEDGQYGAMSDRQLSGWLVSGKYSGEMYAEGVRRGLIDSEGGVTAAAQEMASTLDEATKKQLGIKSPSKKGYEVGEWYVKGVALGEDENISLLKRQSIKMADAMNDTLENALSGTTIAEDISTTISDGFQSAMNQVIVTANNGFGDFTFDYASLFDDAPISPVISPVISSSEVESAISDAESALDVSSTFENMMDLSSIIDGETLLEPLKKMFGADDNKSFIDTLVDKFTDSETRLFGENGTIASKLDSLFGKDGKGSLLKGFKDTFSIEGIEDLLGKDGKLNAGVDSIVAKLIGTNGILGDLNSNMIAGLGATGPIGSFVRNILETLWSADSPMNPFYDPTKEQVESDQERWDNMWHKNSFGLALATESNDYTISDFIAWDFRGTH